MFLFQLIESIFGDSDIRLDIFNHINSIWISCIQVNVVKMDWREEMDKMLLEFDRQAKHSLANIRTTFKRSGLSFNPKFKQYFLRVSNTQYAESIEKCFHLFHVCI